MMRFLLKYYSLAVVMCVLPAVTADVCTNCYNYYQTEKVGRWNKPNLNIEAHRVCSDGELCYRVKIETDEYGRRKIITQKDVDTQNHLVFFGCSNIFGEGLNNSETLPQQFQNLVNISVISYAMPGTGLVKALNLLKYNMEEITSQGDAVFILRPYHINRLGYNSETHWLHDEPFYIDEGEALNYYRNRSEYLGLFDRFMVKLYSYVNKITFLNMNLNYFAINKERRQKIAVKMIKKISQIYKQRFSGDFIIAYYRHEAKNITYLSKLEGLTLLELDKPDFKKIKQKKLCSCDTHFTKEYNYLLAIDLKRKLKSQNRLVNLDH